MSELSLKSHFQSAIVYYYKQLAESGYDDPVRVIIADFIDTVKVTDKQKDFMLASTSQDKKILDDIIVILRKMKSDEELDIKALDLAEKGLMHLRNK